MSELTAGSVEYDLKHNDGSGCLGPCNPLRACDECAGYWQRMRDGGYWDDQCGWTEKGWKEITK